MLFAGLMGTQSHGLDADQQKGLDQTVNLLKSPQDRQKAIEHSDAAKDVDNKTSALAGSKKNKDEIYGISANVFEKVVKESNGDPEKMQRLMNEATANPEAFFNKYFGDGDKAKVRELATQIEKNNPAMGGRK
jgi:hypothetical protein